MQIQFQESVLWDLYDDIVHEIVACHVEELAGHELIAVWLQTSEGEDWAWKDEDEREPEPPALEYEIVEYLTRSHVYREASDWTNARIRS